MISRGAQIMPDEVEPVAAYLTSVAGAGVEVSAVPATGGGRGGAGRGGAGGGGQQAADAGGRAIMQRTCQQCHELATASDKKPTEEWTDVVARMVNYGARLSPADHQTLLQYLSTLIK
jgi:cytochrome c5